MYKYLLFDLDDTLLDFKKAEAVAIRRVLDMFGIDSSDETVELYSGINKSFWERFERGEIKREEIFEGRFKVLAERLKIDLDTGAICKKYFENLSLCGFTFEGAIPLLQKLKDKYLLCAATNGALITQERRIAASGIEKYFNGGIYISEAMGCQKPQKEYFEQILKALGNPPKEQVLMLGDSLSGDIAGAKNSGIDCCFVNLRGQILPEGICPNYIATSLEDIPTVCGL